MKKKLDESEGIKRIFFLNFDMFTNILESHVKENSYFYTITNEDKHFYLENVKKVYEKIVQFIQRYQFPIPNLEENLTNVVEVKEEPTKPIIVYEEKYKEEYKNAEEIELSKERLEQLKNSILIENTPLGNVIMFYDSSRETFTYYSDSTIPYRYLEVVARKYVVKNRCKKLYVDMEKELKEAEEKIEKKKRDELEKKQLEEENKEKDSSEVTTTEPVKKSVFAKLKKYNRDNSLKSSGIPTDNKSISKKIIPFPENNNETSSNNSKKDVLLLKENANRYSYEGKMVNFSFLKKVERKAVDKRYAMNFSDFKKMMIDKKNKIYSYIRQL